MLIDANLGYATARQRRAGSVGGQGGLLDHNQVLHRQFPEGPAALVQQRHNGPRGQALIVRPVSPE